MSPADPRFVNVRVIAWLVVAALVAAFVFLLLVRSAGADAAARDVAEEQADSAAARAERIARERRVLLRTQAAELAALRDRQVRAAEDSVRADAAEQRYRDAIANRAAAERGETVPRGTPVLTNGELLELADSALTACTLARTSCVARAAAAEALVGTQAEIIDSQAREIEQRKAIEEALRRMQPSFWDAAREVAIEAGCGAGGAAAGVLVAYALEDDGDGRQLLGAAAGALVGVVSCAIATR